MAPGRRGHDTQQPSDRVRGGLGASRQAECTARGGAGSGVHEKGWWSPTKSERWAGRREASRMEVREQSQRKGCGDASAQGPSGSESQAVITNGGHRLLQRGGFGGADEEWIFH